MITKTALIRALQVVDKDKRPALPFACSTTSGWLWAGPLGGALRQYEGTPGSEGGEIAAASAAILRDASELARRSEKPARPPGPGGMAPTANQSSGSRQGKITGHETLSMPNKVTA